MAHFVRYEPRSRADTSLFESIRQAYVNVYNSWDLIWVLFKRDFVTSYKRSILGIGWLILGPILGILSWLFMNLTGLLNPGALNVPYPVFALLGSLIWGGFIGFYAAASNTLLSGAGFLNQVRFPHEALFVKQTLQHLANFAINACITILVILPFGILPSWKIVFVPFLFLPLFFIGSGLGLVVGVVSVVVPDVRRLVDVALGVLMFITPIFYSPDSTKTILRILADYNPLSILIGGIRDMILDGRMDRPGFFFLLTAISMVFFVLAWRAFFLSEDKVVEKMM